MKVVKPIYNNETNKRNNIPAVYNIVIDYTYCLVNGITYQPILKYLYAHYIQYCN